MNFSPLHDDVVANFEDLAGDMIFEGIALPEVIKIIADSMNLLVGILTTKLIAAGKIPADTDYIRSK
jgi:hypothetical protein